MVLDKSLAISSDTEIPERVSRPDGLSCALALATPFYLLEIMYHGIVSMSIQFDISNRMFSKQVFKVSLPLSMLPQ